MVKQLSGRGRRPGLSVALPVALALLAGQTSMHVAAVSPVFGPVDVVRRAATPEVMRWTFAAAPGAGYLLCVDNGGQRDQYPPVTSANITINGAGTFQPRDFKRSVATLSRPVSLLANNQVTADLTGLPGSGITLWIEPGASCAGTRTNVPPVVSSTPVTSAIWLEPYVYPVTATDADHDPLTFSLPTAPSGMTITPDTGEIAWTPPGPGTVNVAVGVDDGHGGTATQSFAVTVDMPSNRPPALGPIANRRIPLGAPFKLALAANDPDPGDTLTFALLSGPTGASVTPSPLLAWTPGIGQLGFHSVSVGVQDAAGASASTSFTIEVIDSQGAPLLDPQPDAHTTAAVPFTRAITAVDPNEGDTLTFALVGGPTGLTVSPQGALAWTATSSQFGAHAVTVKVNDNTGLSDVATFTITVGVAAVAQPPVAVDDQFAVRKLTTLTVPAPGVLANDLNPSGQPLTAQLVTPPTKGALALSPNGGFSYTPTPPAAGATTPALKYSFHGPVFNGVRGSNRATPVVADLNRDGVPEIVVEAMWQFTVRRLFAIRGDTGTQAWAIDAYQPNANPKIVLAEGGAGNSGSLAVGDLDGDGYLEILAVHSDDETSQLRRKLIAFNHDGSYRWTSDDILDGVNVTQTGGMFAIDLADLDGDGHPEIIVHHSGKAPQTTAISEDLVTVFNGDGHIRWTRRVTGTVSQDDLTVADVDLDGKPDIAIGGALLDNQGNIKWNSKGTNPGFDTVAVANLDSDPFAEIVYVDRFGNLYCYEHTGAKKWGPVARPGGGTWGGLTIGDTDGDGIPEIVFARENATGALEVRDRNGNLLRTMMLPAFNTTAYGGNTTIFDLDGDGHPEVIYQGYYGSFDSGNAHGSLYIFDGATGSLLHEIHAPRGGPDTGPIVADVNADGSAEIVAGGWDDGDLVNVFKAASGSWAQTRPIWNQDSYHVTNVATNGSIPASESVNWLTPGLNNYRVNVPLGRERTGDADQFTYTASDESSTSNVATVRLDILPPNTAPRILSFAPLSAAGGIEYLYAVRAADPDLGEVLGYALSQGPAGMTIDGNTGLLRWTPPQAAAGPVLVVVRVTDSQGQSDSQQFTIIVGPPVIVPSVVGQPTAGAQSGITDAGLIVGTVANSPSAGVPTGQVISQEPLAGSSVAAGAAVNLVVSSGPAPVPVPHLINRTESVALASLSTQGFTATLVRAFSNTVPDGVVMAQSPAAGTSQVPGPVSVTVSVGSGLALRLRRTVTTADAPIPFTAIAYDLTHTETAAPALNYVVTPAITPSFGALPTVGMSGITPASDTRGAFRVTATEPGTGRTASAEFSVTYPREPGSQRTMSDVYAGMSEALADVETLMARGRQVLAANDTDAVYSLLDQMVQRWRQVDVIELRLTTPFGLPDGFFPSAADLASLGLTPTAEDLAAHQVLKDAIEDLEAWTEGLREPSTTMPQLRALADRFNDRARRLTSLHMTEAGVVNSQALITQILSERLPEFYDALMNELAAAVAAGNQGPGPDELASGPSAVETESTLAEQLAVIALDYVVEKIVEGAKEYVSEKIEEAAKALNPIKALREEGFKQAAWTASVVIAANKFKQHTQGEPFVAVGAGASLSFHAFEQPYSFLEGVFDSDQVANNVVLLIGPDVAEPLGLELDVETGDIKEAIRTVNNIRVNGDKMFEQLTKVYDWLKGASTSPSELTNILNGAFPRRPVGENSCLFTTAPDCRQLIYLNGFQSVYQTDTGFGLPAPILFLGYNKTTGKMYVDLPIFIPTLNK